MSKNLNDCFSSTQSIKIGDRTYIIGKTDVGDTVEFQNWCDGEAVKEVIELCKLIGREPTIKELRDATGDAEYLEKKSTSLEGNIFLLLCVLNRYNKDIDEEEVKKHLNFENILDLANKISEATEINRLIEESNEKSNFPQKKKKTSRKKIASK